MSEQMKSWWLWGWGCAVTQTKTSTWMTFFSCLLTVATEALKQPPFRFTLPTWCVRWIQVFINCSSNVVVRECEDSGLFRANVQRLPVEPLLPLLLTFHHLAQTPLKHWGPRIKFVREFKINQDSLLPNIISKSMLASFSRYSYCLYMNIFVRNICRCRSSSLNRLIGGIELT